MAENIKVQSLSKSVTLVTFDAKGAEVNVLNEALIKELDAVVESLKNDSSVEGVVFASAKKDFIVGADIKEFKRLTSVEEGIEASRYLQSVFQKVAQLKVPTVAAIKGNCMGGGLEFALACTWRVAVDNDKTVLALPEIMLGLIPGAGGTQRLPRLVGIQAGLDLILTGKNLRPSKALKIGLIDAKVPASQLLEQAQTFALRRRKSSGLKAKDVKAKLPQWAMESNPIGRKIMQSKAREMVDAQSKGFYPAPYKALEAVFRGFDRSIPDGLEVEAKQFGELLVTRESKSLIHLFFATTALKKNPHQKAVEERFGKEPIRSIGVVGGGFMGAGIATVCADRGIRAMLSDPNAESLQRALSSARGFFKKALEKRRIKKFELDKRMAHISPALSPVGFRNADLVIEAVFEDMQIKRNVLKRIEEGGGKHWIFASNTSALPIADIAKDSKHKDRVCGMHFFSPVEKMPLLEIVATKDTAPWVLGRAFELGNAMGKKIIIVQDSPGFYTTRALAFFLAEAASLLTGGVPIEMIDRALTKAGFPVGPITLIDEVGIDVGVHVLDTIRSAFSERLDIPDSLSPLVTEGRKGRKNQRGFYLYENGKKAGVDQSVYSTLGIKPDNPEKLTEDEIAERCLLQFVNESVHCLAEGVLEKAYDGDVGAVFGLGFPPTWGGPFKYVDHLGASEIVERMKALEAKVGKRFKPASMLVDMAKNGTKFFPDE